MIMTPIKYSRQSIKALVITIVSVIGAFILCIPSFFLKISDIKGFLQLYVSISAVALFIAPLLLVYCISKIIAGVFYLGRLKANGFMVPRTIKEFNNDLRNVPLDDDLYQENRYAGDSRKLAVLSVISAIIFVLVIVLKIVKWSSYCYMEETAPTFVFLLVYVLAFAAAFVIFIRQGNKDKYIDDVDFRDSRKVRTGLARGVLNLIILLVIGMTGISIWDGMVEYVYKSKIGTVEAQSYERYLEESKISVSSESFSDGSWKEDIGLESPQISFSSVADADHYCIYFIDETEGDVIWFEDGITDLDLKAGAGSHYEGFIPVDGHVYTLFVYALKDDITSPDKDKIMDLRYRGDDLDYNILNFIKRGHPDYYGNVIAHGALRAEYYAE